MSYMYVNCLLLNEVDHKKINDNSGHGPQKVQKGGFEAPNHKTD